MQTTPRGSNIIQHDDVGLILGEGYQTPAAAKSVQKDAVDLDGERVQLGKKYHTQGTGIVLDSASVAHSTYLMAMP